jgi:hypothetical protein
MENTVISHVDQPKVLTVSGTGAFVAVFFLAWLTLIFVLGAQGAGMTEWHTHRTLENADSTGRHWQDARRWPLRSLFAS